MSDLIRPGVPADNNVPPDDEGEDGPDPAAMALAMSRMQSAMRPGQAYACVNCLNNQKLAVAELVAKYTRRGQPPGSDAFSELMRQAQIMGQMAHQDPRVAEDVNSGKLDAIPAVRTAEIMVQGTSLCTVCFTPVKQTSLILGGNGNWKGQQR